VDLVFEEGMKEAECSFYGEISSVSQTSLS